MRLLRVEYQGRPCFASWVDDDLLAPFSAAPWLGGSPTGERIARQDTQLLAPVTPSKIVCVGRNYAAHARELGSEVPDEPLLFLKPPSALLANGQQIVLTRKSSRIEHEAEIGVVMGQRLHHGSLEDARRAIYGITCVNDVTARDLQRADVQFTRAKSFDSFCPTGPWLETDFALDALSVIARVNGTVRQQGHVRDMIFSILELVSFISGVMTLEPGDLISTGTPEGVGPLSPGDVVEIEIPGVGTLVNVCAADDAPRPPRPQGPKAACEGPVR